MLPGLELRHAGVEPGRYAGSVVIHHHRIERREITIASDASLDAALELGQDRRANWSLEGYTDDLYAASRFAPGGEKREQVRERFSQRLTGTWHDDELALFGTDSELPELRLRCRPARFQRREVLACEIVRAPPALFGLGFVRGAGVAGWLLLARGGIAIESTLDPRDAEPSLTIA